MTSNITLNDLPLETLEIIAKFSVNCWKNITVIPTFGRYTLSPDVQQLALKHFTVITIVIGKKEWKLNGRLHRVGNLPAVILDAGVKIWYRHGKQYREGGKPIIEYNGNDTVLDAAISWFLRRTRK